MKQFDLILVALVFFLGSSSQKNCKKPKGYPGQRAECQTNGKWVVGPDDCQCQASLEEIKMIAERNEKMLNVDKAILEKIERIAERNEAILETIERTVEVNQAILENISGTVENNGKLLNADQAILENINDTVGSNGNKLDELLRGDIVFKNKTEFNITRDNLIGELPFIGKDYKISFDLIVHNFDFTTEYTSVIHFTIGGDHANYGDRTPAVWIRQSNGVNKFYVSSAIDGNPNLGQEINPPLTTGEWYNVEISQTITDGKFMFEVKVDGTTEWSIENTQATQFDDVMIFSGDDFYDPTDGSMKNVKVESKKTF